MFGAVYKYFFLDEDTLKKVSLTAKNMFIHSLRNIDKDGLKKEFANTGAHLLEHSGFKPCPKGIYREYGKFSLKGNKLVIENKEFISPVFGTLNSDEISKIYTYGLTLGEEVPKGDTSTEEYLFDIYGTSLIEAFKDEFTAFIKKDLPENAVISLMGPGLFGMPMKNMQSLGELTGFSRINMQLTESYGIIPLKSYGGMYLVTKGPLKIDLDWCMNCKGNSYGCFVCRSFKNLSLGMAIDIGTTTVTLEIVNLRNGVVLFKGSLYNKQRKMGKDVLSRINLCINNNRNLNKLHNLIIDTINSLLKKAVDEEYIETHMIKKVFVCGNPTMCHIFAGLNPQSLSQAPFRPGYSGVLTISGKRSRLNIDSNAHIIVLPAVGNQVGGDFTAGLVYANILEKEGLTVYIDLGTNGEICVFHKDYGLSASTAAGPALEGGEIECGMVAEEGAVTKIIADKKRIIIKVLGDVKPKGICGTGLISSIAVFLREGMISEKGRIKNKTEFEKDRPDSPFTELLDEVNGEKRIYISKEFNIYISQEDIRNFQLAKGAIYAGIKTLLEKIHKKFSNIDRLLIAGSFGENLNTEDAIRVGLIPDISIEKIEITGNSALKGTALMLEKEQLIEDAITLSEDFQTIELGSDSSFSRNFINALNF